MNGTRFRKSALFALYLLKTTLVSAEISSITASKLSLGERHKMEEISSIFENGTPDFQYAYIQDIGDGAGVTAGRLGFNTSAGDLLAVVQKYTNAMAGNTPLAKYIPCLAAYATTQSYACLFPSVDSTTLSSDDFKNNTLVNVDFGKDWVSAAQDPVMMQVQDDELIRNVYDVADDWSKRLGIKTAFAYAVLFDTVIQQGGDEVTNAMGGMVRRTEKTFAQTHLGQASPLQGADEATWLRAFLLQRRETLRFGYNDQDVENSTEIPYQSYPRADSLLQILAEKNPDLLKKITFLYFGNSFELTQ